MTVTPQFSLVDSPIQSTYSVFNIHNHLSLFSELLGNIISYAVKNYTGTDTDVKITFHDQTERISFCTSFEEQNRVKKS